MQYFEVPRHVSRLVLASGSPRRVRLMREAGFEPVVRPQDVDETPLEGEGPGELVSRLASLKAHSALADSQAGDLILAADTTVALDGRELGKPSDANEARRMLSALSGRTHDVCTGVHLIFVDRNGRPRERSLLEGTRVTFFELDPTEVDAYVATGEPLDKAGAYGIQGLGRALVRGVEGDYFNVVGLPVARTLRAMADLLEE